MKLQYHEQVTREAVGGYFNEAALTQIITANWGQDAIRNQFGKPHIHVDDNKIAESLAYIDAEHTIIAESADPQVQREAFGRLLHTVQDYYSHTNYVRLWVTVYGGATDLAHAAKIHPRDPKIEDHLELHSGSFKIWRDGLYYIPGFGRLLRKLYIPSRSHEELHLDHPGRGPLFPISLIAARKRTALEYVRAHNAILNKGAAAAIARFHQQ